MNNTCIHNLLKVICLLQDNSINHTCQNSCEKPFLGPTINSLCYNTRVISIYKKDGSLFTTNINNTIYSTFRIMDINKNCCTLLILDNSNETYTSMNQYITLNIHCIGAIRCIEDINL